MAKERRNGNRADRDEFLFSSVNGGNATDRIAGNGNGNGNGNGGDGGGGGGFFGGRGYRDDLYGGDGDSPAVKLYPVSPGSPSRLASSSSSSGANYIEHPVSKFDTLAGVAIRYGVEVADIKRLNGLTTDIQMFALKSLQIPLPGRHPPSTTCLSNGSDTPGRSSFELTPPRQSHHNLFESFHTLRMQTPQQRVSPAMSSLQGYYGLKSDEKARSEGCEMAVYRKGGSHYLEDGPFTRSLPTSNPPLSRHRKTRSLVNTLLDENGELAKDAAFAEDREGESERWNDKLIRRRQKSEADFLSKSNMPEMLLEDNSGGGFSATSSKGLALRSKAASRTSVASDAEAGSLNPIPLGLGDSVVIDGFAVVRKSSSTSNLHDQESNSSLSSIWPTSKWSLKPDFQALSTVSRARPIFDGLPKPGRRNKTALD
ncbi:hypothetical protein ACJRO7_003794 [Eucalyptus globulus]|uniref:LysM domain-containing protein n=2 Tax=Eucalyptus globulus TaxID=34317 RepID=A0ABD3IV82_EUCGL